MSMFSFPSGPMGERVSFPVVWDGQTTRPYLNDGQSEGWYCIAGGMMFVHQFIMMGASTTFGTGGWFFRNPLGLLWPTRAFGRGGGDQSYVTDANKRAQTFGYVGIARGFDNSLASGWTGIVNPAGAGGLPDAAPAGVIINRFQENITDAWRVGVPFTWAADDYVAMDYWIPLPTAPN